MHIAFSIPSSNVLLHAQLPKMIYGKMYDEGCGHGYAMITIMQPRKKHHLHLDRKHLPLQHSDRHVSTVYTKLTEVIIFINHQFESKYEAHIRIIQDMLKAYFIQLCYETFELSTNITYFEG